MKIYIASDHAGFELKNKVVENLKTQFHITDLGPSNTDSVDYPDFADLVCRNIPPTPPEQAQLDTFGILICGSGQGMALRANKYAHIRAALVYNNEIVQLAREHNNANIICIGSRFTNLTQTLEWINIFQKTLFSQGRHQTRVAKVSKPTA